MSASFGMYLQKRDYDKKQNEKKLNQTDLIKFDCIELLKRNPEAILHELWKRN